MMIFSSDIHRAVQLALQGSGVRMSVMIENVQALVEEQAVGVAAKGQADFDFSQYHELEDVSGCRSV